MEGKWAPQIGKENMYGFNGKELSDEFGLNWNDHGARFYDPAIARWNGVDPLAEIVQSMTPYRFGFNNPLLYADLSGLFETKDEAKKHAKDNGIRTGLFSRNKIRSNKDADGNITYSIDNKKKGTSISNLGGSLGVVTARVTVSPKDVVNVVRDDPNQSLVNAFFNGTNSNRTEFFRDGSTHRHISTQFEAPPIPIGPGGAAKAGSVIQRMKGMKNITLDFSGKFHGLIPKVGDLRKFSKSQLETFLTTLKASVKKRIELNRKLGPKGNHGKRQGQEQDLIKTIEKIIKDM